MLILTRRANERIMIGDTIVITVLAIRSGQVRLGIEAPAAVPVHREEIRLRIERERTAGVVQCTCGSTIEDHATCASQHYPACPLVTS